MRCAEYPRTAFPHSINATTRCYATSSHSALTTRTTSALGLSLLVIVCLSWPADVGPCRLLPSSIPG